MAVQLPLMMQGQRRPPIGPYTAQQRVQLSLAEKQELMGTWLCLCLCLCPLCGSALSLCASCQCHASVGTWGTWQGEGGAICGQQDVSWPENAQVPCQEVLIEHAFRAVCNLIPEQEIKVAQLVESLPRRHETLKFTPQHWAKLMWWLPPEIPALPRVEAGGSGVQGHQLHCEFKSGWTM